jgi:tRNA pseudouridine55 synthase
MGRRRRRGNPVHGWLIIDKTAGMTSTAVVNAVKRLAGAAKAGHAGTLDPLATGVLPVAFGEATKTMPFVVDDSKRYRFTVRWGTATDTDDAEGRVIETSENRPDESAIHAILARFTGIIDQVPPAYSAIKVAGERAYDLARDGAPMALPPRPVRIESLVMAAMPDRDHAVFDVECGPGSYMRALARDLAAALETVGHVVALRRRRVGPFDEADAISLDELRGFGDSSAVLGHLLPVETALDDIPALALTDGEASRLRNGQAVSLLRKADLERIAGLCEGDTVLVTGQGRPVALTRYAAGEVRPVRVLNL